MLAGPMISQALEDVLPTWKREQLATGIDHDKYRYFLPLPIRRFPPAVAKSATVSAVEAFPVLPEGVVPSLAAIFDALGVDQSDDHSGPM
eukprot:5805662-Lingulodinium_polyedra.AAC.1